MNNDDKLHIYEAPDAFEITLKWYSPIAWFLLFFSAVWCGFLFVFYGMLASSGGTPLFAYLFPLLHVAAGIGISYYTACLFFNKTFVDVVDDHLMVHHDPIPWWKGNVSIPITLIDQLYVKESINRGKNGTSTTYSLRAKLKNGQDKDLLNVGTITSEQLQKIETRLEDFLGIQDTPVKGEYGVGSKWDSSRVNRKVRGKIPERRKQRRGFFDGSLETIYLSNSGDAINMNAESHQILSDTQYDWNDGNSDRLFQLLAKDRKEQLVFISQNRALLEAFKENQIPLSKVYSLGFKSTNPSTSLEFNGIQYTLEHHSKGMKFVSGLSEPIEVEQWKYVSSNGKQMLRIIGNQGSMTYYLGEVVDENNFEKGLDLNKGNRPIIENRSDSWEDGDFV